LAAALMLGYPTAHVIAQTDDRPLMFTITQGWIADSNVLRLPSSVDPSAFTGKSARSDRILTTSARVSYDNVISAQRVSLWAEASSVRYSNYDAFNHLGWDVGARWNWEVGRQWYGIASATDRKFLASFADQRTGTKNLVSVQELRFDAGYRLDPRWSVVGAIDTTRRSNSLSLLAPNDYRQTGYEMGARYLSGVGNDFSVVWRHMTGSYPNRQTTDALGNPLPVLVDNGFSQNSLLLRLQTVPTDKSRISGEAGWTRRSLDTLSQRDFSGPTARLSFVYTPSDAWLGEAYLRRDLGATELISASFVDTRTLGGRLTWRPTAKLSLQSFAELRRLAYDGDPGFLLVPSAVRKDTIHSMGLTVSWEAVRNVILSSELRRDARSSNYDQFDFRGNTFSLYGRVRF